MSVHIDQFSIPVETRSPTGRTNAYVVGTTTPTDTRGTLLVDPAARTDPLDTVTEQKGVEHLAVTHTHHDHVGGIAEYAVETDATVWARRGYEDSFESHAGIRPDETFTEGTRIGPCIVLDTSGHARDHVAFVASGGDASDCGHQVISGDLAVADGSVVVAAPEGDMRGYLTALRRLHARNPAKLHPGHGPTIASPRETLARLITHRLRRERKVLAAVNAGVTSPDAIVERVYEKDVSHVRELARATVVAHLEKLAHERKIEANGSDGWVPKP